jgi:hypothetical protein
VLISGEVLVFPITRDYGDVGDSGDLHAPPLPYLNPEK